MAQPDGSIRIGVSLELNEAKKDLENLRNRMVNQTKEIENQAKAVEKLKQKYDALSKSDPEQTNAKVIKKVTAELEAAEKEAARLDQEYKNLSDVQGRLGAAASPDLKAEMETLLEKSVQAGEQVEKLKAELYDLKLDPTASEEAKKLAEEVTAAEEKLQGLRNGADQTKTAIGEAEANVKAMSDALRGIKDSATVADQGIIDLQNELANLEKRKADLEASGVGLGHEEYDQVLTRIKEINAELKEYKENLGNMPDPGGSKWDRIISVIKDGFVKTVNAAASASKNLRNRIQDIGKNNGFSKAAKNASMLEKPLHKLGQMIKRVFLFSVITSGLRAIREGISKYLSVNEQFKTALSGIKSNLLTAFQPVYEAIIPALTALMQAMERVTAKFAAFMATIFGTTASKAQENAKALYEQANATKKTGEEAKKAEKEQKKYLASFDTIEKLGEKETESQQAEEAVPGFDTEFSEIEPPQWLTDFWAPIKESWDQVGGATVETVKSALGSIWDLLKAIGKTFLDMWNSAAGVELLNNLQLLLQTILGVIYAIAEAFISAWNSGTGEKVIAALFYALNSVLELLISIGQAFIQAWNENGRGVEICNTILQIIANIFTIVGNLASRFREAWEANGNGVAIWGAILDIINIVLQTVERITVATAEWAAGLDLEPLLSGVRDALEAFAPLVQTIGDMVVEFWQNTVLPFLTWLIEDALPQVLEWLAQLFTYLAQNPEIIAAITKLVVTFIAAWEFASIINGIVAIVKHFQNLGKVIVGVFQLFAANPMLLAISAVVVALGVLIANWDKVKETVSNVINAIVGFIQSAIDKVKEFFSALSGGGGGGKTAEDYSGSGGFGRSASPQMASYDSPTMFSASDMPRIAAYSAELTSLKTASVPQMARAAVASPNNDFISGKNNRMMSIDLSAEDIEQAFKNVLGRRGETGVNANVSVSFNGSLAQLARILQPEIKVEQNRRGPNLIGGIA